MDFSKYFQGKNLKKTKQISGVYFEQKITPDLLAFAAECILQLTAEYTSKEFRDKDIRALPFYAKIIKDYLSKPSDTQQTNNEYNKLISYQLGLLCFAGVLKQTNKRPLKYQVKELEILKYIAVHERQALEFLKFYLEKLLQDNSLVAKFENYRNCPSQESYEKLKDDFYLWARSHTNVRTNDRKHTYRVFNKIFNLYAYFHSLPGEYLSRVTSGVCPYLYLVYNRINFRDVAKAKNISRKEYDSQHDPSEDSGYLSYLITKAKNEIKERYPTTEITEYPSEGGNVVQVHHIFPAAKYQEFASSKENLISITPGQHNTYAHKGNTNRVEPKFQIVALIRRLNTIEDAIHHHDNFFNVHTFIAMLNSCLDMKLSEDESVEIIRDELQKKLKQIG